MTSRETRRNTDNEAFVRVVQKWLGIDPDGWAGSQTSNIFHLKTMPESEILGLVKQVRDPSKRWPEDTDEAITDFFGRRGDASEWVLVPTPYPMRLAWDHGTLVNQVRCHRKVKDSLLVVLEGILDLYGSVDAVRQARMDLFGGIVKVRRMRGSRSRWSRHSWGVAIDLDPTQNGLSTPWPSRATMPEEVIRIFEAEGWKSLARARGNDAMHFQATA